MSPSSAEAKSSHADGSAQRTVFVAAKSEAGEALRALVSASSAVGLTEDRATATLHASIVNGEWSIATGDGKRVVPLTPVGNERLAAHNIDVIVNWMRWRSHENRDPASAMAIDRTVRLYMMKWKGNKWVPAAVGADGKTIVYEEGEIVGFSVENSCKNDLFVTLIDTDAAGLMRRIYPRRTAGLIAGNASMPVVADPGEPQWRMVFPRGEPVEGFGWSDEEAEYVQELYLLFVTQQPVDFSGCEQEGTTLESSAHATGQQRGMNMGPPPVLDDWTVVRQAVVIRRRR